MFLQRILRVCYSLISRINAHGVLFTVLMSFHLSISLSHWSKTILPILFSFLYNWLSTEIGCNYWLNISVNLFTKVVNSLLLFFYLLNLLSYPVSFIFLFPVFYLFLFTFFLFTLFSIGFSSPFHLSLFYSYSSLNLLHSSIV